MSEWQRVLVSKDLLQRYLQEASQAIDGVTEDELEGYERELEERIYRAVGRFRRVC